jgi:hypothetical protein
MYATCSTYMQSRLSSSKLLVANLSFYTPKSITKLRRSLSIVFPEYNLVALLCQTNFSSSIEPPSG